MPPKLSICIPTYNRAEILDDCLARLEAVSAAPFAVEIVVSDNGSTDETANVIAARKRRNPAIQSYRMPENRGWWPNRLNALLQARGELAAFQADDDSLMLEDLFAHVERMDAEQDLVAIYADWIAWDDQAGRELHRYFPIQEPISFKPDESVGLVNFVLQGMIQPEMAVYRRRALIQCQPGFTLALPFHIWMYHVSRHGRIRFDPRPFYREHRVLREGLARTHWANMEMQLQFIGDEMRMALETLLLLGLQDAGADQVPADQVFSAKQLIDQMLRARISLEIDRACARGDFVLAVELRRRQVLWKGPGTRDDVQRDVLRLVMPAALATVHQTYRALSDAEGVVLRGFSSQEVPATLAQRYPQMPILDESRADRALVVHRDEAALASDPKPPRDGANLVLEQLVRLYRTSRDRVDLSTL